MHGKVCHAGKNSCNSLYTDLSCGAVSAAACQRGHHHLISAVVARSAARADLCSSHWHVQLRSLSLPAVHALPALGQLDLPLKAARPAPRCPLTSVQTCLLTSVPMCLPVSLKICLLMSVRVCLLMSVRMCMMSAVQMRLLIELGLFLTVMCRPLVHGKSQWEAWRTQLSQVAS